MAESIRDVVVRLGLELRDTKLETPNLKTAIDAAEGYSKAVRGVQKDWIQTEVSTKVAGDTAKNSAETAGKAWKAVTKEIRDVGNTGIDTADKLKAVGEGAFTTARGFALLVSSNEKDLQKLLKTVAAFQGAFDVFKGVTETLKGIREATAALTGVNVVATTANVALATSESSLAASAKSAAIQQTALAGANTAVATTATAATVAIRVLKIALGPIGIIATAAGIAVGFLVKALSKQKSAANDLILSNAKLKAEEEALNKARQRSALTLNRIEGIRLDANRERELRSLVDEKNKIDSITESLRKNDLQRQRVRLDLKRTEDPKAIQELGNVEVVILQQRKALTEELRTSQNVIKESRLKGLSIAKQELQTAKELTDESRRQNDSLAARVGQLDALQRKEFERIIGKREQGGFLSSGELRFIQGIGFDEFSQQAFTRKGKATGLIGRAFKQFGEPGRDEKLEADRARQNARTQLENLGLQAGSLAEVDRKMSELSQKQLESTQSINRTLASLTVAVNTALHRTLTLEAAALVAARGG